MGIETPPPHLQSPALLPPPAPVATVATSLAPGFRFHPTDQELVSYYLRRKICGKRIRFDAITETDIYKSEPWDLPVYSRLKSKDNEWYFFGVQDKKYVNGSRVNRATGKGYWKATGNDRPILHNGRTVGMKKTLVFYSGRAPCGKRTNWVMHEYRLTDDEVVKEGVSLDSYLLCKILKKSGPGFKPGEQYGPFVEEEWEREDSILVPGEDVEDDMVGADDAQIMDCSRSSRSVSEVRPQTALQPLATGGLSTKIQTLLPPCKMETDTSGPMDDSPPEPFPVVPSNKKLRCDPDSCLSSEISTTKIHHQRGACSSSTATTTITTANTNLSLEFPFFDSAKPKEERGGGVHTPSCTPNSIIDINVPPSYLKLFEDLRNEIYKISIEKESLKIEVMSARTMINILQSKVDHLAKENEELKDFWKRGGPPSPT